LFQQPGRPDSSVQYGLRDCPRRTVLLIKTPRLQEVTGPLLQQGTKHYLQKW
jgi:hypothetical protein